MGLCGWSCFWNNPVFDTTFARQSIHILCWWFGSFFASVCWEFQNPNWRVLRFFRVAIPPALIWSPSGSLRWFHIITVALENGHGNSVCSHQTWWIFIALCNVYQRVTKILGFFHPKTPLAVTTGVSSLSGSWGLWWFTSWRPRVPWIKGTKSMAALCSIGWWSVRALSYLQPILHIYIYIYIH